MELILRSTFESLGSSDLLGCTTPNDVVTNVNMMIPRILLFAPLLVARRHLCRRLVKCVFTVS
jgi:hypothetical protein